MTKVPSTENLLTLSKDTLFEIASNLDYDDIKKLCSSHRRFYYDICNNPKFWEYKYQKDTGKKLNLAKLIEEHDREYNFMKNIDKRILEILNDFINFEKWKFNQQIKLYKEFFKLIQELINNLQKRTQIRNTAYANFLEENGGDWQDENSDWREPPYYGFSKEEFENIIVIGTNQQDYENKLQQARNLLRNNVPSKLQDYIDEEKIEAAVDEIFVYYVENYNKRNDTKFVLKYYGYLD